MNFPWKMFFRIHRYRPVHVTCFPAANKLVGNGRKFKLTFHQLFWRIRDAKRRHRSTCIYCPCTSTHPDEGTTTVFGYWIAGLFFTRLTSRYWEVQCVGLPGRVGRRAFLIQLSDVEELFQARWSCESSPTSCAAVLIIATMQNLSGLTGIDTEQRPRAVALGIAKLN
jgi:hypothetical protein